MKTLVDEEAESAGEGNDDHSEEEKTPFRERVAQVAQVGATILEHRELFVHALELLRKSDTVSAQEEARIVAAYREGSAQARQRLAELVENLQEANFGKVVIALRDEREQLKQDLRTEGKTLAAEGRLLVDHYLGELQRFLERNEPTLEAIEDVSRDLADAGRTLAASLKFAGREAADELIKRGGTALRDVQTEEIEAEVIDWARKTVPRADDGINRVLNLLGFVFLAVTVLLVGIVYKPLLIPAAILAAAGSAALTYVFFSQAMRIRRNVNAATHYLDRLAAMSKDERHDYFVARWRKRHAAEGSAPESGSHDAEPSAPGPVTQRA